MSAQKHHVEAVAVFSGGGVKGVALAGAYQAAVDAGFVFRGFGGTSAGAIVACLASAGLSGKLMFIAMSDEKSAHPIRVFKDEGGDLAHLRSSAKKLGQRLKPAHGPIRNYFDLGRGAFSLTSEEKSVLATLFDKFGVLDGGSLKSALIELLSRRFRISPERVAALTFSDWTTRAGSFLKIVSSDVAGASPVVFCEEDTPEALVVDAVVASAAFPFAFQPRPFERDSHPRAVLLDGGLASNTPAFLFRDAFSKLRLPTIVFQLKASETKPGFPNDFGELALRVIDTAVNASDRIIGSLLPHTYVIEVSGCDQVDTLGLPTKAEIEHLYDCGKRQREAIRNLADYRRQTAGRIPRGVTALGLRYGNPSPFLTTLTGFRLQLYTIMVVLAKNQGRSLAEKQSDLRVALFVPEDMKSERWRIAFHLGFGDDKDVDILFPADRGCVGAAFQRKDIAIDDTDGRRSNPTARNGPTKAQLKLVPKDRRAVMACPIFAYDADGAPRNTLPVIGLLTVDSTLPLSDTGWTTPGGAAVFTYVSDVLEEWSSVCSRLLMS